MRRSRLASDFGIGETLSEDMRSDMLKSQAIVSQLPEVVAEHLLIQVAEEMERFHANVGSFESALEQAPEVFESVGVNLPVNIRLGMVNDLVRESGLQVLVGHERVGINCTASRDVFF